MATSARVHSRRSAETESQRNSYVSQTDIPARPLEEALRVPQAIADHYAYRPTPPLRVASAMGLQPSSSNFRMLSGAAIAFGLTEGGSKAPQISLTPLGLRIVRPLQEGDDSAAKREALMVPRVIGTFLKQYDSSQLPRRDIGVNVLTDLGVPRDRAEAAFDLIIESARSVGLIHQIKGRDYVDLQGTLSPEPSNSEPLEENVQVPAMLHVSERRPQSPLIATNVLTATPQQTSRDTSAALRRVFVTHGKNRAFLDPIKKLIGFGKLEAVVSIDRQTVSKPVPDKVISDMRSCGSAIIHVDGEPIA
jgi:hypothetical protein